MQDCWIELETIIDTRITLYLYSCCYNINSCLDNLQFDRALDMEAISGLEPVPRSAKVLMRERKIKYHEVYHYNSCQLYIIYIILYYILYIIIIYYIYILLYIIYYHISYYIILYIIYISYIIYHILYITYYHIIYYILHIYYITYYIYIYYILYILYILYIIYYILYIIYSYRSYTLSTFLNHLAMVPNISWAWIYAECMI